MDKTRKKQLKHAWRDDERQRARAAFPLPLAELQAMFDMLDRELPLHDCDRTRRLTQAWLESKAHPVAAVFAWLDQLNGFCDCQILNNVEQHVIESSRA